MKIEIEIPDNCELKQNGNVYTVVEKESITYETVAKELFDNSSMFYIGSEGEVIKFLGNEFTCTDANNCVSEKQANKLLAVNKLMNVAKYLNGDWKPDWHNIDEVKYYIGFNIDNLIVASTCTFRYGDVYFKSGELVEKAIEILGEDTIKLVFCTDY